MSKFVVIQKITRQVSSDNDFERFEKVKICDENTTIGEIKNWANGIYGMEELNCKLIETDEIKK